MMSSIGHLLLGLPLDSFGLPTSRKHLGSRCQPYCKNLRVSSCEEFPFNKNTELEIEQLYGIPDKEVPEYWDVVGLGQAMVDFSGVVGDDFLDRLGLEKGVRKIVNHEERGNVLRALDGRSYKLSAGGSLSNTLVALARLGMGHINVAMTGSVGSDPLGDFYRTKLRRASVHFLSQPVSNGTTGTVIVLTTPDAQRAMLSYQGMSSMIECDSILLSALLATRILIVEGYLWEIPKTIEVLHKACAAAHEQGVVVVLTTSDVSCMTRHQQEFWDVMANSADVLFANGDEARALCGFGSSMELNLAAGYLSRFCPFVSVTDGARGSYIAVDGEVLYVPPSAIEAIDTCGAGDAYAGGILYGMLCGFKDVQAMGNLAAKVAATVVSQRGTRLKQEDALHLARFASSMMQSSQANV